MSDQEGRTGDAYMREKLIIMKGRAIKEIKGHKAWDYLWFPAMTNGNQH